MVNSNVGMLHSDWLSSVLSMIFIFSEFSDNSEQSAHDCEMEIYEKRNLEGLLVDNFHF